MTYVPAQPPFRPYGYWRMTLIEPIKALIRFIIWKLKGSKDD